MSSATHAAPTAGDLARHYSRFRVTERLLLTGHSHQAWPDVGFDAQQQAWLDAANLVDDKWDRAAAVAEQVRQGWRRLLNDDEGDIALGQNTHELIVRFLSAVLAVPTPTARGRTQVVTTDGEFHSLRRQLDRLSETGVRVVKEAAQPVETLAERLGQAITDETACVCVSSVLFETAEIVPHLDHLAAACDRKGVALLVDAYHHLNVVPFHLHGMGLSQAFVVGGGYKYCQLGEGNCFLRVPADCELRPVITGWFSEFGDLAAARTSGEVRYGRGAARFAGATYDPASHYRAAAVFDLHQRLGLTATDLRTRNARQTAMLEQMWDARDIDPRAAEPIRIPAERRGGFFAIRTGRAAAVVSALRRRGAFVDARGSTLRIGPAPYVTDSQLHACVELVTGELLNPNL